MLAVAAASWFSSDALAIGGGTTTTPTNPPADVAPQPEGLKGVLRPAPSNFTDFIVDKNAAVRLGKALFWDMQLASDGRTACASCHFQAGADSRSRNQVSPGLNRMANPTTANPDTSFQVGGPNYQFKADDFPFHKLSNPNDRNSTVLRSHNDVASSQGVFNTLFRSVTPGASADSTSLAGDPTFQIGGLQTRRVEPRNSPTVINSVFNFRNFWDGRAEFLFNGVSPFGALDAGARVYKKNVTLLIFESLDPVQVRINNASLASLATGPALSLFEMSAAGRNWPQIGRRLLSAKPLAQQQVSATDSVLAPYRDTASGKGLNTNYESMVKAAFQSPWWSSTKNVTISGVSYNQREANFSLFFGLAIQAYLTTQVSDDSPFDQYMAGNGSAMSSTAAAGMGIFFGKGSCAECHGGAEFTNASVRNVLKGPLSRMTMGNGATAVYDEGFYNTAVSKTLEDIANGATNGVGRPTSLTALAQQVGSSQFKQLIGIDANLTVAKGERIAVNGAFKTPTIRNAELTAPFFHNGDSLTLEQVVDFYNRGGNHFNNNLADVDPDIKPLGLSDTEKAQLVAFMKATTDERVRYHRAPFDHPQLFIPNGHVGDTSQVTPEAGRAQDVVLELPAVGAGGYSTPPKKFLE